MHPNGKLSPVLLRDGNGHESDGVDFDAEGLGHVQVRFPRAVEVYFQRKEAAGEGHPVCVGYMRLVRLNLSATAPEITCKD